jgi:hypothetical protein
MTLVTPPTTGGLTLGSTLNATGVTGVVTISALASGVLGQAGSTYTLTGGSTIVEGTAETFSTSGNPGYWGASDAARVTALKSLFYADATTDADRVLIPNAWAALEAGTGVSIDIKSSPIEYDDNLLGKVTRAYGVLSGTIEAKFRDIDANHMIDLWSCNSVSDTFTTAAGASIAGRKTVMVGRQSQPLVVAMLVRVPSQTLSPVLNPSIQEFQNIYFPYVTLNPEMKLDIVRNKVATASIKAMPVPDASLQGSAALPPLYLSDQVTGGALS